jgi:hypothetical protein
MSKSHTTSVATLLVLTVLIAVLAITLPSGVYGAKKEKPLKCTEQNTSSHAVHCSSFTILYGVGIIDIPTLTPHNFDEVVATKKV